MSKQKSAESKSVSGSAQPWATPAAQAAVGQVQSVVNQNQPALQQLTDMTHNSVVNPLLSQFQQSSPVAGQANNYYSDVLSGKYMSGNPFLGSIMNRTNRDTINNVNSQFELAGRYGSDAHGYGLARGIADSDNALQYQNYSDEAARRDAAAQAARAGNTADVASLISAIGANAELPYTGTNNLANSLGALFNGGTSNSVQYSPNPIWGAIGAGLGAAGAAASGGAFSSDRRLKTNITKVGEFSDGLGIYEFAYKSDPRQMFRGVMADEVKELRPQAYIPDYRGTGFAGVNYGAL